MKYAVVVVKLGNKEIEIDTTYSKDKWKSLTEPKRQDIISVSKEEVISSKVIFK